MVDRDAPRKTIQNQPAFQQTEQTPSQNPPGEVVVKQQQRVSDKGNNRLQKMSRGDLVKDCSLDANFVFFCFPESQMSNRSVKQMEKSPQSHVSHILGTTSSSRRGTPPAKHEQMKTTTVRIVVPW